MRGDPDPSLLGFGHTQANCAPSCFKQTNIYNFGLGVVRSGSWLLQDPLLSAPQGQQPHLVLARQGQTNAKGQFVATFKDPVSATWQAVFEGNDSNGVGHLSYARRRSTSA